MYVCRTCAVPLHCFGRADSLKVTLMAETVSRSAVGSVFSMPDRKHLAILLAVLSLTAVRVVSQQNFAEQLESTDLAGLKMRAENGDALAQFRLGYLYEQGIGVPRDYRQAAELYRAAAVQGHSTAANNLAVLYDHGLGVKKDLRNAIEWYRVSAERGDSTGQCNLASVYFSGRGIPRDYNAAMKWFRAAAEHGLPAAQNNLAYMYYNGIAVSIDYSQAARWTRSAAEQGYALAETDLGYLFEQGKGVPLDYTAAYMWYTLGDSGGDPRARARMKSLFSLMLNKQRTEARARAAAWVPAAASRHADAQQSVVAVQH